MYRSLALCLVLAFTLGSPLSAQSPAELSAELGISEASFKTLFSEPNASAAPRLAEHNYRLGYVVARFKPELTQAEVLAAAALAGAKNAQRLSPLGLFSLQTEPTKSATEDLLQRVWDLPGTVRVTADYIGSGGYVPNDTFYSSQWHLDQSGPDIDAPSAWDITRGSSSKVVAIIDSGWNSNHPDFLGGRIFTNAGEVAGDGIDNDSNGYIDDTQGWDFVGNDSVPNDQHSHGTWVQGVYGATANNTFAVAGLDHFSTILPLKILDSSNSGFTSSLINALDYVLLFPEINVVSMSLINFPLDSFLANSIEAASQSAMLISCAGNGGANTADTQYPGAHPATLSVGSTTSSDSLASFSSTGSTVDVTAPGDSVVTVNAFSTANSSSTVDGCSFATPLVAGTASLLLDVRPNSDQVDLYYLLRNTSLDLGASGRDDAFGVGRLDVDDLLELALELVYQDDFETGDVDRWSSTSP